MAGETHQRSPWPLSRKQRGVITTAQLIRLGYSEKAIEHRVSRGRLHRVHKGVYAVGRRELSQEGEWMAATLACGETAALSHESAVIFWKLAKRPARPIHVSVLSQSRSRTGIEVHRRAELKTTTRDGIRVTTPAQTLIDIAHTWDAGELEQAIGEADLRRLVSLRALRTAATRAGRPGAPLRRVIERATFRVTQSELERRLLRIVAKAALPTPETQTRFGKHRVDFYWPAGRVVLEADGGRFHRTAAQQTRDRKRDQAHFRAGRIPLRVTHAQVFFNPAEVIALLADVFTAQECRQGSESTALVA